ncbi:site-specific integrase [Glaciecola siphonariae]|uniref:Site-specific integrase n=1 Tax=Glaciecola siphonariae TaxID=521012 RepID=A0ABV9LWY4_9ALTE
MSKDFDVLVENKHVGHSKSKLTFKGFPTFYNKAGQYIRPINLWLNYLQNERCRKDISPAVRAIKRYWDYLEKYELKWDKFYATKSLNPTFRYRNDDLLLAVKNGTLNASTASLYIQLVINFYEWAAQQKLVKFSHSSKPFDYQIVQIPNRQMMRHVKSSFSVKSTDLRIKVPRRTMQQSINPLSQDEIKIYFCNLQEVNPEFRLHQLLQLNVGLRIKEACTFPLSTVIAPPYSSARFDISIGPFNGVATKFGTTRTVEISASLMKELYDYSVSERRYKKSLKAEDDDRSRLLLNREGKVFSVNTIHKHFYRVKKQIEQKNKCNFSHKPHDLRATYATYRLASLLDYLSESDALLLIMGWMGHKNESTVWKYIRFLRRNEINQEATCLLDKFLDEALNWKL